MKVVHFMKKYSVQFLTFTLFASVSAPVIEAGGRYETIFIGPDSPTPTSPYGQVEGAGQVVPQKLISLSADGSAIILGYTERRTPTGVFAEM